MIITSQTFLEEVSDSSSDNESGFLRASKGDPEKDIHQESIPVGESQTDKCKPKTS